MKRVLAVGLWAASLGLARPAIGQGVWTPARCDLKTGHFKVNSAQLYLKSAYEKNNRDKDLKDALKNLNEAITLNGQDKNGAAWYYLGRYYVAMADLAGVDSAFARADALAPQCQADTKFWRRFLWTAPYNTGVAALNAGHYDSAITYFNRANVVYRDAQSLNALGILYFNSAEQQQQDSSARRQQLDSAAKYFQATIGAATDTQAAIVAIKKSASFDLAAAYQSAGRGPEAAAAFRQYLITDPNDAQAIASLATLYAKMGQKDSAELYYKRLIQRADSVEPLALFQAGVDIYSGAPPYPDTAAIGTACRDRERAKKPSHPGMTAAQRQSEVAKTCNRETADTIKAHQEVASGSYLVAAQAFHAVLKRNGEFRDALYNLTEVYFALDYADSMLSISRRLVAVDPMNRTSTRLHAQAWQLKAEALRDSAAAQAAAKAYRDSAYKYVLIAAESLPVEVTLESFRAQEQGGSVKGHVTNFHEQGTSAPMSIVFEFLSATGAVIGSQKVAVPALAGQASHAFDVQVIGKNITAYRYRRE